MKMRKFSKLARILIDYFSSMLVFWRYTVVYTTSNKRNCIDCICMQEYFETWKYICFWGARFVARAYKLHVYMIFVLLLVHLGISPHTKKLATLLALCTHNCPTGPPQRIILRTDLVQKKKKNPHHLFKSFVRACVLVSLMFQSSCCS